MAEIYCARWRVRYLTAGYLVSAGVPSAVPDEVGIGLLLWSARTADLRDARPAGATRESHLASLRRILLLVINDLGGDPEGLRADIPPEVDCDLRGDRAGPDRVSIHERGHHQVRSAHGAAQRPRRASHRRAWRLCWLDGRRPAGAVRSAPFAAGTADHGSLAWCWASCARTVGRGRSSSSISRAPRRSRGECRRRRTSSSPWRLTSRNT